MLGRIKKRRSRAKITERRDALLSSILQNAISMPSCSYYEGRGFAFYEVSLIDSSRYAEYVRLSRSRYDVQGVKLAELRKISKQHRRLKEELLASEEALLKQ